MGIPADDLARMLVAARPNEDEGLEHIGIVGDTYTLLLTGEQTAGKFCLIDMHIPPGGGPPPHRHDFEETFVLMKGEMEATFRGEKKTVKAGETVHIPANAPHMFHNSSEADVRLLCLCAPAGQEGMFRELGERVATRTTPPRKLSAEEQEAFAKKAMELAATYKTEMLKEA
jgi:quercetin dioxygenase-like cupin family protein